MSQDLEHAKHNQEACDFLHESGRFNDWVVTTAFYAALYYVNNELFPAQYDVGGKPILYRNFDEYLNHVSGVKKPHNVRLALVAEYLPDIYAEYKTLHDQCWTSRYKCYSIQPEIAVLCRQCMQTIKEVCSPVG